MTRHYCDHCGAEAKQAANLGLSLTLGDISQMAVQTACSLGCAKLLFEKELVQFVLAWPAPKVLEEPQ